MHRLIHRAVCAGPVARQSPARWPAVGTPRRRTNLPTLCPAALSQMVHTRGNTRRTAHIPAIGGDNPEPLCVRAGIYSGGDSWALKSRDVYPDPNKWFELCEYCLSVFDDVRGSA